MRRTRIQYWLVIICIAEVSTASNSTVILKNDECKNNPNFEQCSWHYLAYFPRIFRTGFSENIMLSVHGYPKEVKVNVSLLDVQTSRIFTSQVMKVQPEKLTTLPLYIDHNAPSTIKLRIEGTGDAVTDKENNLRIWQFQNTSENIEVQKLGLNIFIQTDRPIYKPGQKIQSRVIVVDTNLKPYDGEIDLVVIENPSGSRMKQWKNVRLEDGFAAFELQTSEKPVTGQWKIKVELQTYKKELFIEVKKYVLPKFQVSIQPPKFVSIMDKEIVLKVCAKYSYGKDVNGNLKFEVCANRMYWSWHYEEKPLSCASVSKKIIGCTEVTMDTNKLFTRQDYGYSPSRVLQYKASVNEIATGINMNASEVNQNIEQNPVKLTLESRPVFKPGFPVDVKVIAKYPDGKMAIDIKEIQLQAGSSGYYSKDLFDGSLKLQNGWAPVKLPPIPFNAQSLYIMVSYTRDAAYVNESTWSRQSQASLTIKPWYSPSHSYLHIKDSDIAGIGHALPLPKGPVTLEVGYTSVDAQKVERDIYYSLMCAGNIALSGSVKRTFDAAIPANSMATTESTSTKTTTITTSATIKQRQDFVENITTSLPAPLERLIWWNRKPVTRPPLPLQFSLGSFNISFDLSNVKASSCNVIVYYMRGEEVVAEDTSFQIQDEIENQIKIAFDHKEVRPGTNVTLIVSGYPKSRVAIAAVDKSIHFLAEGNDLKKQQLNEIRESLNIGPGWTNEWNRCYYNRNRRSFYPGYSSNDFVDSEKAFANAGVTALSNLRIDNRPCVEVHEVAYSLEDRTDQVGLPGPQPNIMKKTETASIRPRTEFPETWLWTENRLSDNGTIALHVKVPDTITSWYASGFGISKAVGLGVAAATELTVFQPFFISLNLPYSVIRGEDVTIPAAVFSYLDDGCITVKITLAYSKDYQIIAGPSAKSCICEGRTTTVLFRIRPKQLGRIPIKVAAETLKENVCAGNKKFMSDISTSDNLIEKLLVEADGIKAEYTESSFFCPKESTGNKYSTEFKLRLPENVVKGSVYTKITAMGDIMGSSLANVDELLAMPYGCGEQNMLKFAPNIFIMNYLKHTNQVNEEIKARALNYMLTGYQKELTYQHKDGAYSAFGERDEKGSTWLTAFVLKSYAQARPWIDIDPKDIQAPKNWLINIQDKNGCFPTVGELHNIAMKGGVRSPVTLTAYVLISLLEAGLKIDSSVAGKASECVLRSLIEVKDSYSLAIISYMFAKMKDSSNYHNVMSRLEELAINEDGMSHWEEVRNETKNDQEKWWYYKPRSTDIEQTAYVLLAKLEFSKDPVSQSVPVVRWLSRQRNSLGGWSSTQDTVLAMQALSEFAAITYGTSTNMKVTVKTASRKDGFNHTFFIDSHNNLVLQRVEDVPIPSTVKLSAAGSGCALVQVNVQYNIKTVEKKLSFEIAYNISTVLTDELTRTKSCKSQDLRICARWLGQDESNMAIVDVQMISGFEANQETMEEAIKTTKGLKDVEIKGKSVMYYFNRLNNELRCFVLRVHQTANIRNVKPATMTVYDYYDTGKSSTVMYSFTENQCQARHPNAIDP